LRHDTDTDTDTDTDPYRFGAGVPLVGPDLTRA
jgi:hypothetical protein